MSDKQTLVKSLTLMDGFFMVKVFEEPSCAELLLKILLEKNDLEIQAIRTDFSRKPRLVMIVSDSAKKGYVIEVQRCDDISPLFGRAHQSRLDVETIDPDCADENIPDSYVVFIMEKDEWNLRKPLYSVERTVRNMENITADDGSHIIYVNGENRDNTPLGRLMHDFCKHDPDKISYEPIARRIAFLKTHSASIEQIYKFKTT